MPGTVLSQTTVVPTTETRPRMPLCPLVYCYVHPGFQFWAPCLIRFVAVHPESPLVQFWETEPMAPLWILSLESLLRFVVVADSDAVFTWLQPHGGFSGEERALDWESGCPDSSTVLATHDLGGPGESFPLPEYPALFCHHQRALKWFSENNPSTGTISLINDTTSSPSFALSFFLSSLELRA